MAESCCPKCSGGKLELKENEPVDSDFKLMFVQCAACGAVVGTMDFFSIGSLLGKQAEALKRIGSVLNVEVQVDP